MQSRWSISVTVFVVMNSVTPRALILSQKTSWSSANKNATTISSPSWSVSHRIHHSIFRGCWALPTLSSHKWLSGHRAYYSSRVPWLISIAESSFSPLSKTLHGISLLNWFCSCQQDILSFVHKSSLAETFIHTQLKPVSHSYLLTFHDSFWWQDWLEEGNVEKEILRIKWYSLFPQSSFGCKLPLVSYLPMVFSSSFYLRFLIFSFLKLLTLCEESSSSSNNDWIILTSLGMSSIPEPF